MLRCNLISDERPHLTERMKFNIVEVQEMFENYLEKKDLTLEVCLRTKLSRKASNSYYWGENDII